MKRDEMKMICSVHGIDEDECKMLVGSELTS
jgi:hypothetical protein